MTAVVTLQISQVPQNRSISSIITSVSRMTEQGHNPGVSRPMTKHDGMMLDVNLHGRNIRMALEHVEEAKHARHSQHS